MLQKGTIFRGEIIDVNNRGDGIAKKDGVAVFVKGGVTGDIADIKIIKCAKNYAVGIIDELFSPSTHRCENNCPVYKRCGGCVSRHINYDYELELKRGYVVSALKRAGINDITVNDTVSTGITEGYRNKAQYPVRLNKKTGKAMIGFFNDHTHEIADTDECKLAPAIFTDIVAALRSYIDDGKIAPYDEENGTGVLRHIFLRYGETSGDVMLCLVINAKELPDEDGLIKYLRCACPSITGILLNINEKDTNVILSDDFRLLWGKDHITDVICGRSFKISKSAFYQVNRSAAELLYQKACELCRLGKDDILVDLYSGVGTVGMSIADRQSSLYGVEIVPEAIKDAKINAETNGFEDAHFLASDACRFSEFIKERENGRLVITVDPPRKGLAPSVIRDIVANDPDRVVYISCNPDTLARDIVEFRKYGFDTSELFTFDLFPRTGHVETVVLLSRKSRTDI